MTSIYYRVNDKIIFNHILARYESFTSKKPIEFICHDEQYNQLNWLEEPAESLDQLMDQHAINLRNTHQKLVLLWSGGTDSHTVYNVFKRNNIHIDEIVFFAGDQYEPWLTHKYVDWLRENHHDPLTKITVKNRFDPGAKQQIVNNEDWVFQNITMIPKMVSGICDPVMQDYCAEQYGGATWCLVVGVEQPRVFFKDGKYYACQDSKFFIAFMGFGNAECFYTEPRLALKQSHTIKRMLKLRTNANISNAVLDPDGSKFKRCSNATYVAWQRGVGRHNEVLPGVSWFHKGAEKEFDLQPVNSLNIDGDLSRNYDLALNSLLEKDDDMAKIFVRGIKNLLLEKDFCDHLLETSTITWQDPASTRSVIGKEVGQPIYSKFFCIGE
jgi:hypothetical protein